MVLSFRRRSLPAYQAQQLDVYLYCTSCRDTALHRMRYAGRLLYSSRCSRCGHEVHHEQKDFGAAYFLDLEHRLLTKPRRLIRRAQHDPVGFWRTLPASLSRQPRKMWRELRLVLHDLRRRSP